MLPVNEYRELTPSQAWHCFIEYMLKPFVNNRLSPKWQGFREDELWVYEVELVYTLNNA